MKKAFLLCFSLLLLGFATAMPTTAASCCKNQCSSDSTCDRFCGGSGLGRCVQINSCCRTCACAA
ncbi:MAG TPA: hypothetical protein VF789_20405 [Thermoanaerobaculia bacterium]